MNDAEKLSAIKRINERLADIKRGVSKGEIPKSWYDRFRNAIDQVIPKQFLTKSGNISHGKGAIAFIKDNILRILQSRQTRGQIKESAERHIREENPFDYSEDDKIPKSVVEEYLEDADYVNTELTEHYNETYNILDLKYRGTKGKKSYSELKATIEWGKALGSDEVNARLEERGIDYKRAYFE